MVDNLRVYLTIWDKWIVKFYPIMAEKIYGTDARVGGVKWGENVKKILTEIFFPPTKKEQK